MINVIRKTPDPNGIYYYVQHVKSTDYIQSSWEHDPDISNVVSVPKKYWKYDGTNIVAEMSQAEKDAVDSASVPTYYELEQPNILNIQESGRYYLYENKKIWVTDSDDNYGSNYIHFSESGGSGELPINEWEHQGHIVSKGDIVKKLVISGRTNRNIIDDIEYALVCKTPVSSASWESGIKSDGEIQTDYIFRDFFLIPDSQISGDSFTGNITRIHRRTINLNFEIPDDGFISLWIRPKNIPSQRTFFISTYKLEIVISE